MVRRRWKVPSGREENGFRFALIVITAVGGLLTFLFLAYGTGSSVIKYLYYGFVLMMAANAVFPHLAATVITRKYAPGTLTGLMLNLPVGLYLVFGVHSKEITDPGLIVAFLLVTAGTLLALRPLFRIGDKIIDD